MDGIQTSDFDYSLLNNDLAEKIKEKDYILIGLHSKYSKEVGKVLYEAQQDFSDYNNGGLFEKWYTSRGFKKRNVYNYIQIYNEVQSLHGEELEVFERLPKSLQIETSKKTTDIELKQKVLDGDITTHKQYRELQKEKEQAERQLEQVKKSEEIAISRMEEAEEKEPKEVTIYPDDYEYIKDNYQEVKKMKDHYKEQLDHAKKELNKKTKNNDYEINQEKRRKEYLQLKADNDVLSLANNIDDFLKDNAVTSYREGAIAKSDQLTKEALNECLDSLKKFISEIDRSLKGRIKL